MSFYSNYAASIPVYNAGTRVAGPTGGVEQSDSDDERGGVGEPDKKKRKRNRIALSCVQCKRRKVKCSRTSPCEACIRHGCADECKWEEGAIAEQGQQPFAMAADLRALESRYRTLERYVVDKLAVDKGELATLLAQADSPLPLIEQPRRVSSYSSKNQSGNMWHTFSNKDKEEDVATVLEELAMGPIHPISQRSPAHHMKPTAAKTTIMLSQSMEDSERMSFLPPHEFMSRLTGSLPSDDVVQFLVKANSSHMTFIGVFHIPTLHAEVGEFLEARRNNNLGYIDPAWLAFFLTLLCTGLHDLGDFVTTVCGIPIRDLKRISPFWLSASRAALNLSFYFEVPQYRAVATLMQFVILGMQPLGRNKNKGVGAWLAAAIRQAQAMSYHQLGSDEETMPPDDPGLPAGSSGLKRQMAIRAWYQLFMLDTIISHLVPFFFMIEKEDFDTAMPANIADESLGSDIHIVERPAEEHTQAAAPRFKHRMMRMFRMALNVMRQCQALSDEQGAQQALELDRTFRKEIENAANIAPSILVDHMTSGLMARMLRCHRSYAEKAYNGDKTFEPSRRAYLEAAFLICHSNRHEPLSDFVFLPRHVLLAVIALYQHRFAVIRSGSPESQAVETANAIDLAFGTFTRYRNHQFAEIRYTAQNGINLIIGMREAEKKHRKRPQAEPFIAVVKRVGQQLTASNGGFPEQDSDGHETQLNGGSGDLHSPVKSSSDLASAPSTVMTPADPLLNPDAFDMNGFSIEKMGGMEMDWAALFNNDAPFDPTSISLF